MHHDPVLQPVAEPRHVVTELVVGRLLVVGARAGADLLFQAAVERVQASDLVVALPDFPPEGVHRFFELRELGVADLDLGAQQPQLRVGAQELLVQRRVLGLPERGRLALVLGQQLHLPRKLGLELGQLPRQLGDLVVLVPELLGHHRLLLPGRATGRGRVVVLAQRAGEADAVRIDATAAAAAAATSPRAAVVIVTCGAAVIVGAGRGGRRARAELRPRRRRYDIAAAADVVVPS